MQYSSDQVISLSRALVLDNKWMSGHTAGGVGRVVTWYLLHNVVDLLSKSIRSVSRNGDVFLSYNVRSLRFNDVLRVR